MPRITTADSYYIGCQTQINKWFADRKLNADSTKCKPLTRTWAEKMYAILRPHIARVSWN